MKFWENRFQPSEKRTCPINQIKIQYAIDRTHFTSSHKCLVQRESQMYFIQYFLISSMRLQRTLVFPCPFIAVCTVRTKIWNKKSRLTNWNARWFKLNLSIEIGVSCGIIFNYLSKWKQQYKSNATVKLKNFEFWTFITQTWRHRQNHRI